MTLRSVLPAFRPHLVERDEAPDSFFGFRREMDRLFDDFFRGMPVSAHNGGNARVAPSVDIKETASAIEVSCELPGVDEKDVQVEFSDNMLTLKGEKKLERDEKDKGYHVVERSYGSFARSIPVMAEIDQDKIDAQFAKGVLKVTLPKAPERAAKTKRIEVRTA